MFSEEILSTSLDQSSEYARNRIREISTKMVRKDWEKNKNSKRETEIL